MLQVAQLTVGKVAMLLTFIAIGYILRVTKKLPDSAAKVLSALSAVLFCPAYNLRNLWQNFTVAKIGQNARVTVCCLRCCPSVWRCCWHA